MLYRVDRFVVMINNVICVIDRCVIMCYMLFAYYVVMCYGWVDRW